MDAFRTAVLVTTVLAFGLPAYAQTARPSVLVKAGANIERAEDATEGESFAFGADLLVPLGDRWTFDVEFWLPRYFTFGDELRHRDILFSVGVLRYFGDGRTRPFLSFGLGVGTTQEQRPEPFGETSSANGFWSVGFGANIAVNQRVSVVPDVRATLSPGAFILRPAIGVAVRF
jgi:hypothetical protein